MFTTEQRQYLEAARIGRLATADGDGRPHAIPVCFALVDDTVVIPIDEKPKRAESADLERVRNIQDNARVALVVDHYSDDWSELGWVLVRGTAAVRNPDDRADCADVDALRDKYPQYEDHDLEARPVISISPGSLTSWGTLETDPLPD